MFIQEKWVTWSYVGAAGVPTIMRGTVMSYYFINVVKISCRSILSFKFVDKIYISHMSILIFTKIWISKMKVCSMQLHSIYIYSTFRSFNLLSLSFLLSLIQIRPPIQACSPIHQSVGLFFHRTFFVRGRLLWYGVNDVIRPSYQFYHTPRTSSYKFYISSLGNFVWYVIYLYVHTHVHFSINRSFSSSHPIPVFPDKFSSKLI